MTFFQEHLSEQRFYVDLVFKFRNIIGKTDCSVHIKKIGTHCYEKKCYNMDILWQTAYIVVNTIMVANF